MLRSHRCVSSSITTEKIFFNHNYSTSYSVQAVVSDILMFFIHWRLALLIPHSEPLSTCRWDFRLLKSGLKLSFSVLNVVAKYELCSWSEQSHLHTNDFQHTSRMNSVIAFDNTYRPRTQRN